MPDARVTRRLSVPENVVFEVLDGEAVLLNLTAGVYFGLNPTGTRVWELLREHPTRDGIRRAMLEEFDVEPAALDRDLDELFGELLSRGLLIEE